MTRYKLMLQTLRLKYSEWKILLLRNVHVSVAFWHLWMEHNNNNITYKIFLMYILHMHFIFVCIIVNSGRVASQLGVGIMLQLKTCLDKCLWEAACVWKHQSPIKLSFIFLGFGFFTTFYYLQPLFVAIHMHKSYFFLLVFFHSDPSE